MNSLNNPQAPEQKDDSQSVLSKSSSSNSSQASLNLNKKPTTIDSKVINFSKKPNSQKFKTTVIVL
jgi:hypothetical protein